VFAEIMQAFVLRRAGGSAGAPQHEPVAEPAAPDPERSPAFTHLEAEVYAFLRAHAGTVCDREAIKRAVWQDSPPSDSALQKIIERIRDKIEADPKNPRRLIAVRGQGYILRPEP
jgi:two-component system phosphate regulon response regulator OmpR